MLASTIPALAYVVLSTLTTAVYTTLSSATEVVSAQSFCSWRWILPSNHDRAADDVQHPLPANHFTIQNLENRDFWSPRTFHKHIAQEVLDRSLITIKTAQAAQGCVNYIWGKGKKVNSWTGKCWHKVSYNPYVVRGWRGKPKIYRYRSGEAE